MSATIVPLRPRSEPTMTDDLQDPVAEEDLAAWAATDLVDTAAFDDAFFDQLAADIDAAVAEPAGIVVPLRPRRPHWVLAAAALILLGLALTLGDRAPEAVDAVAEDATPSLDELARSLGASALQAVLDGADEDDTSALLASRSVTLTDDDDALPTSYGSLLEQLDDVSDYDTFFPL